MRPIVPLTLLLALPAHAKRPDAPTVAKVPSIEEVVAAEGFTPTPSQSEIYKPGAVLVPNGRGGHDVVVSDCIDAEPDIAIMSQSSIATTLAGGVSARLGVARGTASAGVEKRLSFVDPEQRTISLGLLNATDACSQQVQSAARFQNLSDAIVLHDVLVAIIKNTVCTRADASGGMVALGQAEAAAYSECVQESDGQVPLGYKAVPLDKVLAVAGDPAPTARSPTAPATASSSVSFGTVGGLGVEQKLREQACNNDAQARGKAARAKRIEAAAADARGKATRAWGQLAGEANACTGLARAERDDCIQAVEQWLAVARQMPVELPAGEEPVDTDCGRREPAFPAESTTVAALEVDAAEDLLKRLKATDTAPSASGGPVAREGVLTIADLEKASAKSAAYRQMAREKRHQSIQFLKDILANRSPSGTQKAEMMLRLAELYLEEGKDIALDSQSQATAWYDLTAKLSSEIVASYPAYQRADEATYLLGEALYLLQRRADAVKEYSRLVRSYSSSAFVPDAYVRIGEYYFDQNDLYKALLAYQKASRYKNSSLYAFSSYKLAWCYYNVGEYGKAIETIKGAVHSASSAKDKAGSLVAESGLEALVRYYRDSGEADQGRTYFQKVGRSDLAGQL